MAVTSVLSTEAEMDAMAGEDVDTTGWTDANRDAWGIQAEATLNLLGRYDFVTNVATLDAKTKAILSEYVARYTGMSGIMFNMTSFSDRVIAENMVNVHIFRMRFIENLIRDQDNTSFVNGIQT